MVHQALGRGVARFLGENKDGYKGIVIELQGILRQLLPTTTDVALEVFAKKVVTLAVAFKAAMMEEQALYQVFWVGCRKMFQENRIDVVDENPSGYVLLCTFPGLERVNQDSEVTVVKASGLLRSAFRK